MLNAEFVKKRGNHFRGWIHLFIRW